MNKGAALTLLAITLALGAYIFVFERGSLTSGELQARKGRLLSTFVRDKVDRLEVQRKGKQAVVEREKAEDETLTPWKMLEPVKGPADEEEIDRVLGELEWLDARRTLTEVSKDDLQKFGLDKPRYRISYRAGGERHTLALGHEDARGQGVYAQIDGKNTAYIVPKTLLETVDHEPGHFRGKDLVSDITIPWVRKLEITRDGTKLELQRDDKRWWLSAQPKMFADDKTVAAALHALDEVRASRFLEGVEAEAAKKDLSAPKVVLSARIVPDEGREDKAEKLVSFWIGGACGSHQGEVFASADQSAFVCIKAEDVASIAPDAALLKQTSLFGFDRSEIEGIEHSAGKVTLKVRRDGSGFKAEGNFTVDATAVEAWLRDLSEHRALRFAPTGPFQERARLSLRLAGDKTSVIILGGVSPDGSVSVRRDDEPVIAIYGARVGDDLWPTEKRFHSLELWARQPSEIKALDVVSGAFAQKLVLRDGAWRNEAGTEVTSQGRVRDLVREIAKVEALAFVTDRARTEHGFAAPAARLVLHATDAKGSETDLSVELGAATARGAYARKNGLVYEVPNEVVAHIRELAGGEPAPQPEADAEDEDHEGLDHGHDHEAH